MNSSFGLNSYMHSQFPGAFVASDGDFYLKNLIKFRNAWNFGLPSWVNVNSPGVLPVIIAIGGGKGGVGKSLISANVAANLGQAGYKVLIVDLDLGSSNLHTYFGLSLPKKTLVDFTISKSISFEDLLLKTPAANVTLAAGGKDEAWSNVSILNSSNFYEIWDSVLHANSCYGFQFVVLDLGAGTQRHTIDFFTSAHMGIMTVLPEPTSIENAYSFMKAFLLRIIDHVGCRLDSKKIANDVKRSLFNKSSKNISGYYASLKNLYSTYPELVAHILQTFKGRKIGFVVNQARSQKDIDIADSMASITNTFFGFQAEGVGFLNYDEAAWKSLRNKRLLTLDFPHSLLSKGINIISRNIYGNLIHRG